MDQMIPEERSSKRVKIEIPYILKVYRQFITIIQFGKER